MLRKLRPRSAYDVMAAVALAAVIAGGSAYAAATIGSSDIKKNAVKSSHIKDGQVKRVDLSTQARAKLIDYRSTGGPKTKVMTLGDLRLSAECAHSPDPNTSMRVYVKNVGSDVVTADAAYLLVERVFFDEPQPFTWGQAMGPGDEDTIADDTDQNIENRLTVSGGLLKKAEGQLVMRAPGRVTTVTFHAAVGGNPNGFCQLSGTAVFADS